MTAAKKLPDWIQLPTWWNSNFNLGELAGDPARGPDPVPVRRQRSRSIRNLAALPTGAWQIGAWGDKLYGIPSLRPPASPSPAPRYYRRDILDPGASPPTR